LLDVLYRKFTELTEGGHDKQQYKKHLEYNIKMDLGEIGWDCRDWIGPTEDMDQ
jgi:hypothetical protein